MFQAVEEEETIGEMDTDRDTARRPLEDTETDTTTGIGDHDRQTTEEAAVGDTEVRVHDET